MSFGAQAFALAAVDQHDRLGEARGTNRQAQIDLNILKLLLVPLHRHLDRHCNGDVLEDWVLRVLSAMYSNNVATDNAETSP